MNKIVSETQMPGRRHRVARSNYRKGAFIAIFFGLLDCRSQIDENGWPSTNAHVWFTQLIFDIGHPQTVWQHAFSGIPET